MRRLTTSVWLCALIGFGSAGPASAQQADTRLPIALNAAEKAWLFNEMRENVVAIQAITAALSENDAAKVQQIASALGMEPWSKDPTRPPNFRSKFPPPWSALAVQVHKDFDAIAVGAAANETTRQMLARVGKLMQNCVGCHAVYRVVEGP